MALTDDMIQLLSAGVAHQVGACTNAGRPVVCRGLAAQHEAGRLLVIISAESGFEVLDAIRQNGNIAVNVTLPENYRSISFIGNDAVVRGSGAAWRPLVDERQAAFCEQLKRYGIPPEYTDAWYSAPDEHLVAIRFTPMTARNQTPGPGAGDADHAQTHRVREVSAVFDDGLSLFGVRRMMEGVIPPVLCTVSPDRVPNVSYLSLCEYVDPLHIALSYQFFNRSRENVLATRRASLTLDDPYTGGGVVLQLEYQRTETEGPVFERLRAKLMGVASHIGMDKVFHLRGADIYRVLEMRRVPGRRELPAAQPRVDLRHQFAPAVRTHGALRGPGRSARHPAERARRTAAHRPRHVVADRCLAGGAHAARQPRLRNRRRRRGDLRRRRTGRHRGA